MQKVIYFTAGIKATAGEITDIGLLNTAALPRYEVQVLNGAANPNYGYGKEEADLVAGTIPVAYAAVTEIDPENLPSGLPATQTIVSNTQQVTVPVTGVYATKATFTVAGGVITAIVLS